MRVKSINTVITMLIAVIVFVSVSLGVLWVSLDTEKVVLEEETVAMKNMVRQSMTALDEYIGQTESMARMLASQQVVRDALVDYNTLGADQLFRGVLDSSKNYWAAFVFDKNGNVVAGYNAKGVNMAGADRSSRGYVKAILSGKSDNYLSDKLLRSKSGDGILIFAVASVVRDDAGEIIGGIGLFPKWEEFTSKFIDPFRIATNGYGFMFDSKGITLAHAMNKKLLFKDLSKLEFIQTMITKKNGVVDYVWNGENKTMAFESLPRNGWIIGMSAYETDMAAAAINQRNILAFGGLAVAIILIGIMVFSIRKLIISPVKGVLEYASEVAGGDLKAKLEGSYNFEFESLAQQVEAMVNELKIKLGFSEGVLKGLTLPCALVGSDFKLLWVNQQLFDLLEKNGSPESVVGLKSGEFIYDDPNRETLSDLAILEKRQIDREIEYKTESGDIKNIQVTTTPFFDMDGALLGSLALWIDLTDIRMQQKLIEEQNIRISKAANEAEEISQSLSSAAEELSAQIEEASRGSDTQKERAEETSTAMEEMNATVLEVAQNASRAAEDADTAKEDAQSGEGIVSQVISSVGDVQTQADGLKVSMEELGVQAAGIGNVLEVITDIADQTNLLALNAAIEAARAGEAGRGFAVVADEVRKLAEKTMSATGQVGEAITKIQAMTKNNVKATEKAADSVAKSTDLANQSGEALREIVGRVENAADQVRAIATAAEQQSATSEEINRATEEINRISIETSQVMLEAAKAIQEVAAMASRLNVVIEDMGAE
jgi:methyl-accepting chemotaxis protein